MNYLALIAFCFACFMPLIPLQASDKLLKIGNFDIDALDKKFDFILDDGRTYRPTSSHEREKTLAWQLGDSILLLQIHHKNRYWLINKRTGQKAKMRLTHMA